METYYFQIYPAPDESYSEWKGKLIYRVVDKDNPISFLTEQGYTFYKFKFIEVYSEGKLPVRVNPKTMFEEYLENMASEDDSWVENA